MAPLAPQWRHDQDLADAAGGCQHRGHSACWPSRCCQSALAAACTSSQPTQCMNATGLPLWRVRVCTVPSNLQPPCAFTSAAVIRCTGGTGGRKSRQLSSLVHYCRLAGPSVNSSCWQGTVAGPVAQGRAMQQLAAAGAASLCCCQWRGHGSGLLPAAGHRLGLAGGCVAAHQLKPQCVSLANNGMPARLSWLACWAGLALLMHRSDCSAA